MIGLDSNVVLRYITQDDLEQAELAGPLIEGLTPEEPGYLSLVALVEIVWVLKRNYRMSRLQIGDIVTGLLNSSDLVFQDRRAAHFALRVYRDTTADFGDALIADSAHQAGCVDTVTFDRAAAAHCGMRLLSR